jgi:filamentous hemagglutinin family protein
MLNLIHPESWPWWCFKNKIQTRSFLDWKKLESEIWSVLAEGEDGKVFINNEEGIWFGGKGKTKIGKKC